MASAAWAESGNAVDQTSRWADRGGLQSGVGRPPPGRTGPPDPQEDQSVTVLHESGWYLAVLPDGNVLLDNSEEGGIEPNGNVGRR